MIRPRPRSTSHATPATTAAGAVTIQTGLDDELSLAAALFDLRSMEPR